ncbi:bifunctional acetate--CoA ligase family protein/GNAT family N-acetyltransferase [Denitromonas ohlonensis]|uniref:Bifunctional acetate--CoA ligase family protein/GNAT family N-acetyltransferase n=2 Tax=Denitromonas TaxID=139331 RepID=A0A558E2A0_9RHOO|nr:bifunctional acetate--CoA ligase family protein/GNAT family N-acetyltransferase [Denitromonas ohlonensis]TVT49965.1 MAG: bifunctional acetate--CoA ligase family protein/GNAT family N-acetyltransferase [Denitromonas halophila]TVO65759.1 bifunctional acetate--CoA ligase family protein/GNAT family N-acetyltransferase [Denitromonas ohlonensis]TVO79352.1 bifunctional acetate--CoA ligase family protein/GNAT family N-acetyltransferase [Denitromonas ohlonensis]TVT67486.1 MAG: bifunctional acetate--C
MKEKHYLTPLFEPKSVGVIGASERETAIGGVLIRNMLDAGFKGKIFAINPKHDKVHGVKCYKSVEDVPQRLDLVVIATAAQKVPAIIDSCGRAGVKAAIVLSAGFSETGPRGAALERSVMDTARRHKIRLLGPNCLGIMRPDLGLNATFAHGRALPGSIGLISQSGALCTAILDWARPNNVGFSAVVSLGSSRDVDFGEALEFMISDPRTESIFLYVEGLRDARRFMSALRGAARVKPVLLIKVGRHPEASKAVLSHTGAQVGDDAVFDAAIRRAGVIRLYSLGQLFAAANALFSHFRPRGNRLAIITNGGGPGVMAADRALDLGIPLSQLSDATMAKLNACLPATWSHGNPIDILGDADVDRYRGAIKAVLEGPNVDGVLVMLTPQAMTRPTDVAKALIEEERSADKPVVTCFMGEEQVGEARKLFEAAGIPTFRTPEPAVELFSHISAYYRNQKLLAQTPASLSQNNPPSIESARLVIETALNERRKVLNEMESKAILAAFRIPIAQTVVARSATEAMVLAEEIGLPVVMKIDSLDITHKSDVGGVRLNLTSLAAVRTAYQEILEGVRRTHPNASINGIAIEPMVIKRNGRELMVGVRRDPVFGPIITFGEGGTRVEVQKDRAIALPPLNSYLARDLIRSTRVSSYLDEFRNMPPINMEALEMVLLRVSEMVCELPWLKELDINPLIVDENGAVAVDARIVADNVSPTADRYDHMAIHPYPQHLTTHWTLPDGTDVTIRAIKPEDADLEVNFVRKLSAETKYFRFMNTMRELPPAMVVRLTQIDYDREMAFVATVTEDDQETEIGVCRYAVNPDGESCEFAVVVADDWQHRGLARRLMGVLIETARNRGLVYMNGVFLANNDRMLRFVQSLGFVLSSDPDDSTVKLGVLSLQD